MRSDQILHVDRAEVVGDHQLYVVFDDHTSKTVDLAPILEGPIFEPLREPEYCARASVDPVSRTIVWPNGADIAPEALYDLPDVSARRRAS